MRPRLAVLWGRISLAHQFMLASLIVLAAGMAVTGWWVAREIEAGVINRTAGATALYVNGFLSPLLQELAAGDGLTPEHLAALDRLVRDTPLGQEIVAFKVWNTEGRVVYSANPTSIGAEFPIGEKLGQALDGHVSSGISELDDQENILERGSWSRLLETYSPVRKEASDQIIAVVEYYQAVDSLEREIAAARGRSWLVVGVMTLLTYLLLAGIVRRGSDTIARQREELGDKVVQLTALVNQNEDLHDRVRRAAARTTSLNERFLRRISAELHDGPSQDLGLALLRLDSAIADKAEAPPSVGCGGQSSADLEAIQGAVRRALEEVRGIAAGLRLPELEHLTLPEALARVVRSHERRTNSRVTLESSDLPEQAPLSVKITLYRLTQEALSNSYRHAGGLGQRVRVEDRAGELAVVISDEGPGFDQEQAKLAGREGHLGLMGMRERVESLGGTFHIETSPGLGTRVLARYPIRPLGVEVGGENE